MDRILRPIALCLLGLGLPALQAEAQPHAATGSRAAGMGGAYTGVADDASAVYWNPAALAAGAIVSFVVDLGHATATPDEFDGGQERSSFLIALSTPAVGLGYYRLRSTQAAPAIRLFAPGGSPLSSTVGELRTDSLVTHHTGVTLVQSITQGVAVGSTLKFVRGIAASEVLPGTDPETALEAGADLLGRATNRFDLDLGIMAYGGPLKVGLTIRNMFEPEFPLPGEAGDLALDRQARAGLAYAISGRWLAAADFDLTTSRDAFGERRDVAIGVEGRVLSQVWVRSGLNFNTTGENVIDDHRAATYSVGGSYAARQGLLVDGHFSSGQGRAGRQWGIAARFVY